MFRIKINGTRTKKDTNVAKEATFEKKNKLQTFPRKHKLVVGRVHAYHAKIRSPFFLYWSIIKVEWCECDKRR
jgi:hypothetical protein